MRRMRRPGCRRLIRLPSTQLRSCEQSGGALTLNERRVARALAAVMTPLYSEETAAAVGIQRTSIAKALESLTAQADVIDEGGKPRLTDPMFELWLQRRGLTPAAGNDDDLD